jgi:hypothetical protein
MLGGGAGRQWCAEQMGKKMEKGSEVSGRRLLKALGVRGNKGKGGGGGQLSATWGRRRGVGHGTMVSSAERPAAAPNRRALAVALW